MKNLKYTYSLIGYLGMLIILLTIGCTRNEDDLKPATFPTSPDVFIDGFSGGLEFQAFGDSKLTAFEVVSDVTYSGQQAIRVEVPNEGDPAGSYAGGILTDLGGRDLSDYNALTFWMKGSVAATVGTIGFGTDFIDDQYVVALNDVDLGVAWRKYFVPIPDPSKLTQEKGLLLFSDGPDDGDGYTLWIDEVKFEFLENLSPPRATILNGQTLSEQSFIGLSRAIGGLTYTASLAPNEESTVNPSPNYFTFISTDTTIVKVSDAGVADIRSEGTATVTATVGGLDASGSLAIESLGAFTAAPVPTRDAVDVISLFSDAYTNVPVDFYNGFYAPFQTTLGQNDINIGTDNIIKYTELNFVGSEFKDPTVNASEMTHLHIDVRIENDLVAGDFIKIELGDFGADGIKDSGDESSGFITYTAPTLVSGDWVGLDIPLADVAGLTGTSNLWQLIFVTDGTNPDIPGTITDLLVDNIYFYKDSSGGGGGTDPEVPTTAAPTPTQAAADVISIYSDAYTDVAKDGFNFYGAAAFAEADISGNSALKYTSVAGDGGNFQIIELGGANQIDVATAGMTNFRFDLWFPNAVDANTAYLMKLVDIGAATSEAVINVNASSDPAITQGSWLQFDLTLAELQGLGLAGSGNIQQIVIDLVNSGEVYIDNIYFYKEASTGPVAPTSAAPTPTQAGADVISIYSDAYTDVAKDGFNFYGAAGFEEADISGDGALKYTFVDGDGGNFQIIELGGANKIDASGAGMTNFRFDLWFPNAVDANTSYLMKLVNIGAATSEAVINVNASSDPAIAQGSWLQFDLTLTELQGLGLAGSSDIQQIVIDLVNSGEVYIDNIYFYKSAPAGPIAPTSAAPTPSQAEADVISIYSDAYTDVAKDGFNFYGAAGFEEADISGDGALKYTFVDGAGGNFQIIELGGANQIDASGAGMTNFRFDLWFPNAVDASTSYLMKLVDIGAATSEAVINVNASSDPAITQGSWLQFDLTLAELQGLGLAGSSNIQQIVIDLVNSGEVYIDNIYFYKSAPAGPIAPTSAAPTPSQAEADVISIYSDAYTDVAKDGFNFYGAAGFEEADISGDGALKYTFVDGAGGNFQIIELGGANQIDASGAGMTNFRFDLWFPNAVDASTSYLMKLVDIGAATSEAVINVNASSDPAITQGSWLQFDLTLAELQGLGLAGSSNIQQIVIDLVNSGEVYIDNIYFYKAVAGSNFISNGGFETGDDTGWLFFNNGGTAAVISDATNGSSFTAKITSGPTNNPGIKVERFGAGTIMPNQEIEVKLDSKVEALLDGAIVNVLAFSESSTAGVGATLHNLGSVITQNGNWNENVFTFTTGADVSGGVSLLIEVVCGGATTCSGVVYFDNVSVTVK